MNKVVHKNTINKKGLALAFALLTAPLTSMADMIEWSDGFESYASGQILDNVGGWRGWDNDRDYAGVVSDDYARSGSNSLLVANLTSAIHPFSGITSGLWELSAWQYIPDTSRSDNYFMIQNQYEDSGPYKWAVQMQFDYSEDTVKNQLRASDKTNIILNEWVEILNVINLDLDTLESYYNGVLLSSNSFTRSNNGPLEIANLDLFANTGTAYYDDISLTRVPEPETLLLLSLGLAGIAFTTRRNNKRLQ